MYAEKLSVHFLPSLETSNLSSSSAVWKTPEPLANAAPISCALHHPDNNGAYTRREKETS